MQIFLKHQRKKAGRHEVDLNHLKNQYVLIILVVSG